MGSGSVGNVLSCKAGAVPCPGFIFPESAALVWAAGSGGN